MEERFLKITAAVYRILEWLPDGDPLKRRAKEKALSVLENATLIFGNHASMLPHQERIAAQLAGDIAILEGYLELGKKQGWIDDMNFLIIANEYRGIKSMLAAPQPPPQKAVEAASEILAQQAPIAKDKEPKRLPSEKSTGGNESLSKRQQKILEILSGRDKTQVSDIIKELPDVTKRTIRRDLDDLLHRRKIVREGAWNQVFYRKAV